MKNIVAVKVRPRIIRNRSTTRIIPANIIVTPSAAKNKPAANSAVARQRQQASGNQVVPKRRSLVVAQSKNTVKKRKSPKVTYKTRDTTPESIAKIQAIRNSKRGRLLLIVGNGPSICDMPLEQLRGQPYLDTLTINKPDSRLWPTTHWSFFDRSQINRHRELWNAYSGTVFNSTAIREQNRNSMQFKYMSATGWSNDLVKGLYICRSSVYASMQIAAWMDYDRIYIIGCDMNPAGLNGKLHFYGVNPDVDPTIRAKRFEKESVAYNEAAHSMDEHVRNKFYFCSKGINPWGFMERYHAIEPSETVPHILNAIQDRTGNEDIRRV